MILNCVYKKFQIETEPSADLLLMCWFCDRSAQPSCAGLKSRTADALIDPPMRLCWLCLDSRTRASKFYGTFSEVKQELMALMKTNAYNVNLYLMCLKF